MMSRGVPAGAIPGQASTTWDEAVEDYKTTLRRLALRDDGFIESLLADDRESTAISRMDARSRALVRMGALIAMNAAPPSYMSAVDAADEAGVTREEIVGTLIAVMPVVGVARVVSAAPNLGLAIGYDVGEALETLETLDDDRLT
jgi:alkylhydroperoxidase/carboxymuconolactone decarboxylase family protein YurZ